MNEMRDEALGRSTRCVVLQKLESSVTRVVVENVAVWEKLQQESWVKWGQVVEPFLSQKELRFDLVLLDRAVQMN